MNIRTSDPTDYRNGVIGSLIACFVLLAALAVVDRLLWAAGPDQLARHESVDKAR